jgi:hypothetical protein
MLGLQTLPLLNLRTEEEEQAQIINLDRTTARLLIDGRWWSEPWITKTVRRELKERWRDLAPDYYWNWRKFIGQYPPEKLSLERLALQTRDGEIQGAIILDSNRRSLMDTRCGTVYVEYLAAAPRNREILAPFSGQPSYKGAGTALLLCSMFLSRKLGLGGRVTLQTLSQPANWYIDKHHFARVDNPDSGGEYLELSPDQAIVALKRLQREGVY